jgi:hypothetical protein
MIYKNLDDQIGTERPFNKKATAVNDIAAGNNGAATMQKRAGKNAPPPITVELMNKIKGMSWEDIEKDGLLPVLKGFPPLWEEKYKEHFGTMPNKKKRK